MCLVSQSGDAGPVQTGARNVTLMPPVPRREQVGYSGGPALCPPQGELEQGTQEGQPYMLPFALTSRGWNEEVLLFPSPLYRRGY